MAVPGPNGAGKSTFYHSHLKPAGLRFINADVLALELDMESYAAAGVAGSLRRALVEQGESFVFETVFSDPVGDKLASSKIAAKLGMKTAQFMDRAAEQGFLAVDGDKHLLTAKGEKAGVEFVAKSRFGPYFLWPQDFHPV